MPEEPLVTFVVPCYRLAHLLPECIRSILSQSYDNFEVLLLDDCSPDDTQAVAESFPDPRITYIRNEHNLGHLANYNKGIALSRGKYVWLISADDYLRTPGALARYVDLLERNPQVGFAFCPGFGVRDGRETSVLSRYSSSRDRDRLFPGRTLLKRLVQSNCVLTPSGIVRRACYERLGMFDLNMPWCGDWYLWCLFALHYDVAYVAEPMVCYREHHDVSMTTQLTAHKLDACAAEEISVGWAIRRKAIDAGHAGTARHCLAGIARAYSRVLASPRFTRADMFMNFTEFERSLAEHTPVTAEQHYVRVRVMTGIGNEYYWQEEWALADAFYKAALALDPWIPTVWLKRLLLSTGKHGARIRKAILAYR